jgi:2-octaprenyl-6-methoxyphenol hydroxylase
VAAPRDIAIVGGGLVGLCAALVLQHPSRRIDIIEAGKIGAAEAGGLNARSIALSYTSLQIFRALGLWPQLAARGAPIRRIHVSSRGRWGVTRIAADDYGLDALGYVVENQALSECLLDAAAASKSIKLHDEAEFESIEQDQTLTLGYRRKGRRQRLEARLGLIADGARSQARDALGIGHRSVDYGQSVLICNVEVDAPREDTAFERFTARGPLAMLPLGGARYACVWTLQPAQAAVLGDSDDDAFIAALQDCFGLRLGHIGRVGRRFSLPIQRIQSERLHQGRCVLIGNAANALHPVAGQSLNLSLRDVAWLHELLCDRDLSELDNAAMSELMSHYADLRAAEQRRVIRYGDGLVSLFSNRLPILDQARAAGLGLLDLLPPLKTQVAFAGMGLTFGGNRLLRGHL